MLSVLKNVFLTALLVVGATMVTSAAAVIGYFCATSPSSATSALLNTGPSVATISAVVGGVLFAPVSLLVAALTMPPALGLARALKLPRPAFDIVGGAAAGMVAAQMCAMIFLGAMESLARSKGGDPPNADETQLFFVAFGVFGGAILGWLRHGVLVRRQQEPPVAEPAYQP